MWVERVAKCPPARVAIQPPSVEQANDWGKKRRVSSLDFSLPFQFRAARTRLDEGRLGNRINL